MLTQNTVKTAKKKQNFLDEQKIILVKKDMSIITKTLSVNHTNIKTKYNLYPETVNQTTVVLSWHIHTNLQEYKDVRETTNYEIL